jgi:hypothetical protein
MFPPVSAYVFLPSLFLPYVFHMFFTMCLHIFSIGFFHIVFFPYVVHVPYISICFFPILKSMDGF